MTEQNACTLCGAGGHLAAQCNWNQGAPFYSEGICGDGAAILKDGIPVPVAEIVSMLNSAAQAGQVLEGVRAWFEAQRAHVNAVDAYNARLKFVREHRPFGTSVDPEYQLMEEADRKARSLIGPMFAELCKLLAAAPAQGGE